MYSDILETYNFSPKSALEFLFQLYQENNEPVYTLLKIFIPLSLNLEDDDKYRTWINAWLEHILSFTIPEALVNTLLEEFHNCIVNAIEKYDYQPSKSVETRLQRLYESLFKLVKNGAYCNKKILYATVELAKGKGFYDTVDIEKLYCSQHLDYEEIYFPAYEIREYLISNKPIG